MHFSSSGPAEASVTVIEKTLSCADFQTADEIFSSGNFSKPPPITRIDVRMLAPGPFYQKARALYWDFAHGSTCKCRREFTTLSAVLR